jgi:hypothetical protein
MAKLNRAFGSIKSGLPEKRAITNTILEQVRFKESPE